MVEIVTALGFVTITVFFLPREINWFNWIIGLLDYWIIFSSLLVIFVADLKYMVIPDSMVVAGVVGVLLQGDPLWIAAVGASIFFLFLYLLTRGRGMGLGDVKLAFLLGFFLGYPKVIFALYAAFLTGALVGVILMMRRKKSLKSKIAFGPFLIIGAVIALFFDKQLSALWNAFF